MQVKAFYCPGTHWDREWHEPFQEFRRWLVDLIDDLMDLLDRDPEYKCFHLDGQAVVLEDYLEIRPEHKARLSRFLKEKRIVAGPWYDLPDEWLISGESYIRNLMKGMRVCRELGAEPMRFAYTPDQFGHVAALPMIMAGFGLRAGICWRGTQDETHPAQFVWVGPDGSRMATVRLADRHSYAPFLNFVRGPVKREGITEENLQKYFEPYIEEEKARSPIPLVLMLDAVDHDRPDPDMPRILALLKKSYANVEFSWCSLEEFGNELAQHADKLPEKHGELREPCRAPNRAYQYLIAHTLSSRYPLKRQNAQCQVLLEKWAEPLALCQMFAGGKPIMRYLDKAWEYLLKNHPHDSICGCSVDQVHRDMVYRFDQARLIAEGVVKRAMTQIGNASAAPEAKYNIVVYNPLPYPRKGIHQVSVAFAHDWNKVFHDGLGTSEPVCKFRLVKKNGTQIPYQVTHIERLVEHKELERDSRSTTRGGDIYHLAVELDLPACGYTAFNVQPTDDATRAFGTLRTNALTASNGIFEFALHPDGSGTLRLCGGPSYPGLFLYEDCGDSGDGWTRGILVNDITYRTHGSRITTAVEEDGPLRTVFRAEREFDLPREMCRRTWQRTNDRTPMRLTDRICVQKGLPCVRVHTTIENTCKDHRFRVLFPTGAKTAVSFADTPFALVERPIAIPEETRFWHERVNPEKPFTTFFGVQDDRGGLALLAPFAPHEYEVTDTQDRAMVLTLFRSTLKTVGTSGEPDGQLLNTMEFDYSLYPFTGAFDPVTAIRLVADAQVGVRTHLTEELPEDRSFVELVRGNAVATAIKPAADGTGGIIRLWNPTERPVEEEIRLAKRPASAALCNLNEEPTANVAPDANGHITVRVPAKGLATIRFTC